MFTSNFRAVLLLSVSLPLGRRGLPQARAKMSDSEDSDFSDNQSERSSDGEAEEAEENEVG